ncbi:MAG: hypothetical protein JWO57_3046, partial [Pseudonocardiales bacterium]|nr:hypothetical protein [Pseudonocardiales bacterium]
AVVTGEAQQLMPNGTIDDPAAHDPTVSAVHVQATGSTVRVTGTAADPDASAGSISIEIDEGDTEVAAGSTQTTDHRFDVSFTAPDGRRTYTVRAVNVGEGTQDASLTASAIVVDGDPSGQVISVVGGTDEVTIRGVVTDPNLTAGQPPQVRVSIDAHIAATGPATSGSSTGTGDGYDLVVPASPGHHSVTVTYVHTADGQDVTVGSWPVTVAESAAQRRDHHITVVLSTMGLALILPTLLLVLRRRLGRRLGRRTRPAVSPR